MKMEKFHLAVWVAKQSSSVQCAQTIVIIIIIIFITLRGLCPAATHS